MSALQLPNGKQQFIDINGRPLVSGKVYHYIPSTLVPKDTWRDPGHVALNDNPIDLDLRGQASIWGDGAYRQIVYDRDGNLIWDQVAIVPGLNAASDAEFYDKARASGLQIASYDSRALAAAAVIPQAAQTVATGGYYVAGDGGQALYVEGDGASLGGFIDAGGRGWALAEQDVNVRMFGAKADGTDDRGHIQDALDYCFVACVPLALGPGMFYVAGSLILNNSSSVEYRNTALHFYGVGATPIFVAPLANESTIYTNIDVPVLIYKEYILTGYGNSRVEDIRFQQNLVTAVSPVIKYEIFAGHSYIRNVEIRQYGPGDGIYISKGYYGTIEDVNVANNDLVNVSPVLVRTGTGLNIPSGIIGGLLTVRKVTSRGFLNSFILGNDVQYSVSARFEQCECSAVSYGFLINTLNRTTVLDNCYFEGVFNTGIVDKGIATQVVNCHMNVASAIGIDGNYDTRGSVYRSNTIYMSGNGTVGIRVKASGDAAAFKKIVSDNFIFYLNSGGVETNVVGIDVQGVNPILDLDNNIFRPNRQWVGGAGTTAIAFNNTGNIIGEIPLVDALNNFQLYSNVGVQLAEGPTLTQASVTAGALAIGASSVNDLVFTVPTNINSIDIGNKNPRLIMMRNTNTNATFVDGVFMILAGSTNFTGNGILLLHLRVIAGATYAFEISRANY